MPRFRRKVTETDAEQYLGQWTVKGMCVRASCFVAHLPHCHTLHSHQSVKVEPGDWILPEPDGEHYYPVKDEVFRETYEKID
jgi:hypothetical protein